jgi:hypothetical protein
VYVHKAGITDIETQEGYGQEEMTARALKVMKEELGHFIFPATVKQLWARVCSEESKGNLHLIHFLFMNSGKN